MFASGIFISCIAVLLVFNAITGATIFNIDSFLGLLAIMVPIIIISGVNILGSGLSDITMKEIFGVGILIAVLIKLDLPPPFPFDLGLGLGTNAITLFPVAELGGIPFFTITSIVVIAFLSGIILVLGGE